MIYGFPPNVGAVGTAALLDVPNSLEHLLKRLHDEGYDVGDFATDPDANGQSLVAALSILCEDSVTAAGLSKMPKAIEGRMQRARAGDKTVPETLGLPGGGLGGAQVVGKEMNSDDLEKMLGKYMMKKVRKAWPESERGPGVNGKGEMVASGLQLGNIWITVQPLLGVEGDPMRLLFERDLTPHPQYCACYKYMHTPSEEGGLGTQAVIHLGMHGTVGKRLSHSIALFYYIGVLYLIHFIHFIHVLEWLPGQPLGNDRQVSLSIII
jgi:magnesium chelatase subunit H